ncbi:MAG: pallilysin-related adhesin [Spirochaetaceae bacterium]|jgi:hypothetical protein|nr:pallilysin-related adhesin [Spirochaetaceae bacterium]
MKNGAKYITISAFLAAASLISVLLILPEDFFQAKKREFRQTRYVNPVLRDENFDALGDEAALAAIKESERAKVNLEDGEISVATLSEDFDKDGSEEQIIAYRDLMKENNPVYVTYIDYEEDTKQYKRVWSASTPITRPGTVSLFTQDLTGDRSVCVALSGMTGSGEHTMTVFKVTPSASGRNVEMNKIADITIDGAISIIEKERTQAYQLGQTNGASFDIRGRGRDASSSSEFDQIEVIYSYDPGIGRYVQSSITRIPGAQMEAARFRGLLSGNKDEFEQFIGGLWYRVAPDMSINSDHYIYFDADGREIIFYDKSAQQVYTWISSTSTRYGLYISSQNISVATLRRVMDIELESLDSIRVKVFEDVRMKIGLSAPWDGNYRKSASIKKTSSAPHSSVKPYINAAYNSPRGDIVFSPTGEYQIDAAGTVQKGRYVFFVLDGQEYLELLSESTEAGMLGASRLVNDDPAEQSGRRVYRVDYPPEDGAPGYGGDDDKPASFILQHVRLSARGVQDFHEEPLLFNIIIE